MNVSIGYLPLKDIKTDVFMHPIRVEGKDCIAYEPMAEEAVIGLIAKHFCSGKVPEIIQEYFDEMDDGYLFSESNFDEFDLEKIENMKTLIVGKDVLLHPRFENIKKFLEILNYFGGIKIEGIRIEGIFEPSDPELAEIVETEKEVLPEEIDELPSFDGSVVYECDDPKVVKQNELLCSQQFIIANKIKSLEVYVNDKLKVIKKMPELKGTFGIILEVSKSYPFKRVVIKNKS
ncbi:hypothetical protein [Caminibacter sp.]